MYKDLAAWTAIRRAVLVDGVSKRQICRETGLHWATLSKILQHEEPPVRRDATGIEPILPSHRAVIDRFVAADGLLPDGKRHGPEQIADIVRHELGGTTTADDVADYLRREIDPRLAAVRELIEVLTRVIGQDAAELIRPALGHDATSLSLRSLESAAAAASAVVSRGRSRGPVANVPDAGSEWILRLVLGKVLPAEIRDTVGDLPDLRALYRAVRCGGLKRRTRAAVVVAMKKGISQRSIARTLRLSNNTVIRIASKYRAGGAGALFAAGPRASSKRKDKTVRDAVFAVLHTPPSVHGLNRATWKMDDLRTVLMERGTDLSRETIRVIIKDAGYRWRQARVVLTSNDPEYRAKLSRLTAVLSALKPSERFFSIDEFGPFAVKAKGGRLLAAPGEFPSVEQFQKSKGCLILTAALELSSNQVTHFYSKEKNTTETLKLLDRLLGQYADCEKLFLSWGAASWHDSRPLHARIAEINAGTYRPGLRLPLVEIVPLPSRAQFLNVIESVFSGMAKAIIHGSDYESVDAAQRAIDRHFKERNEHFKAHPKRAGKKIWGKEPTTGEFSAGGNHKDPKWSNQR